MWKDFKDTTLIPKEFEIIGTKYKVDILKSLENDSLGDFFHLKHQIRLAENSDGEEIPEDEILKTYLHELGHCFNYYYNSENSEEFANAFSNFFYEYLHTKE